MLKLAFIFNPAIDVFRDFGNALAARYGAVPVEDADILVPVGGDGSVLCALPLAQGRKVYGIIPPGTTSVGYMANVFHTDDDLIATIAGSDSLHLHPVVADVAYTDGRTEQHHAFTTFAIERDAGQAAMMDLHGTFNGHAQSVRLVGDGVVFSTTIGSTGMGWSHHGPIITPDRPAMIMAGLGIGRPRGFSPVVSYGHDFYTVDCIVSHGKRPLRLNVDGNAVRPAHTEAPLSTIKVTLAERAAAEIHVQKQAFHPFRRLELA
jgi:NAD+ kinase